MTAADRRTPSSNPVMRRILAWEAIVALVAAVGGAAIGWVVSGPEGLAGALIGAAMALFFLGVTAASILVANRSAGTDAFVAAFFGIVLGGWLLKFVVFLALVFLLKDQPWLDTTVLFLTIVAVVLGSLVVDVLVVARSRVPVVSDLPANRAP
ncbi:MAG: hypothetical protein JWP66_1135 [Naasia sp.]|nr:hypothetical protein [Naasia sp.]